ncbi:alpha/beta fold hydrolase [uncultured Jatrophihabitans sp.]|uniref:alpha/beta fold hydrolase n=1 Tax=uncultured Jatrophihabitans sp. TaxID=1610747 RepID=UPI0035CB9C11
MTVLDTGDAQPTTLEVASGPVAALTAGAPGAPPVLLLPGYTGSKEDFAPLLGPLGRAGMRAVAVDLPGQYQSPGPDDPAAYTPDRLAPTVLAVADLLGPDVRLLGHSFGGLVARAAVIAAPSAFDSLVLLSSGPAALGGQRRQRIEQLEPLLAAAGLPGVYAAMQAAEAADPDAVTPPADLAAFLRRRFLAGSPTMLQGMGQAIRSEPDRVEQLAAAGLPVLVVHGADDDAWLPDAQHDMARRLGARYAVVPGAAHSAAVENPEALLPVLLDFWR